MFTQVESAVADPRGNVFVGLDGEMSGSELSAGHKLIQAGLAVRVAGKVVAFSSLVGWDARELVWDDEAFQVHKIDRDRVLAAPRPAEVDVSAQTFLHDRLGDLHGRALISVGFNVAAFDHPFFNAALPGVMRPFSRRAVDLNSLCFALDGWGGQWGRPRSWQRWKKDATAWADEMLRADGHTTAPHDAGWDAAQALYVFEFLRAQVHACRHPEAPSSI